MARNRCVNCGASLKKSEQFCGYCGTPIQENLDLPSDADIVARSHGKLVTCPDCKQPVSVRADECPHCGAPLKKKTVRPIKSYGDWGFEWRTRAEILGYPLIHVAVGKKNGKLRVAKGVIAIGQFALGLITIAQFGVGLLFGFGQFMLGATAIAQFAIAIYFGLGQFATGYVAIGQFALGYYALGQAAFGRFIWTPEHYDPAAKEFFLDLAKSLGLR